MITTAWLKSMIVMRINGIFLGPVMTHFLLIEGSMNTVIQPPNRAEMPLFNTFEDKIVIITYDNLRFPAPSIHVINIEKETIGEIVYDKEGSD